MKRYFISLLLLLATPLWAQDIITAEDLARSHSAAQAASIGAELGVEIYDGPYDGELPLYTCSLFNHSRCINYAGLIPGISVYPVVPQGTTQQVEHYIYYNAFRNVNAGFYSARYVDDYRAMVDHVGYNTLLQIEVFILKTGQKPISLFQNFSKHADLLVTARGLYQ